MTMCFDCANKYGFNHKDNEVTKWNCDKENGKHMYTYNLDESCRPIFVEVPSHDFVINNIGYEMKTNKKSKFKKNGPAQILVSGLLASDSFCYVTEKQFYSALTVFGYELRKDSRLKQTHKLETFYILDQHLEYLRTYGIETSLVGFKQYNGYCLHEKVYGLIKHRHEEVENCSVNILLAALKITEFYQEKEHANKIRLS